eukprot:CAMPEP_0170642068 /NCGR_PEP_ID=MMETSP0224-20130122/41125_1 /TAXON_ID=285029 /ORGANISM="Togula jolla, Strain CCCM 725" /LENGTH=224 /DNA_ID=CAMNT_0010972745 /DNA_START=953 /DNA_END=1622 /DNA_ORIENTATION=-
MRSASRRVSSGIATWVEPCCVQVLIVSRHDSKPLSVRRKLVPRLRLAAATFRLQSAVAINGAPYRVLPGNQRVLLNLRAFGADARVDLKRPRNPGGNELLGAYERFHCEVLCPRNEERGKEVTASPVVGCQLVSVREHQAAVSLQVAAVKDALAARVVVEPNLNIPPYERRKREDETLLIDVMLATATRTLGRQSGLLHLGDPPGGGRWNCKTASIHRAKMWAR